VQAETFSVKEPGERLDRYLSARLPGVSRSDAQALIRSGRVLLDGTTAKPGTRLRASSKVVVMLPEPSEQGPVATTWPDVEVLLEDPHFLAVNKPPGLVVHATAGQRGPTLTQALGARYPDLERTFGATRLGLVHRLDKDTSGVLLVARTRAAETNLRRQFKHRRVHKVYLALVHGHPRLPKAVVDAPVGRHPRQRTRMAAVSGGRPSRTLYRELERLAGCSLLEVRPESGRTHQVRVHLAAIGNPVVGDRVYGRAAQLAAARQLLHAWQLSFEHPSSGRQVTLSAPLPDDLQAILARLGSRWHE
jgi:23S rRNA pseudouridine1911/1915/1917 synthase